MSEAPPYDKEMSFWEHLAELSTRLRRIFIILIVLTVIFLVLPANIDLNMYMEFLYGNWTAFKPLASYVVNKTISDLLPQESVTLISTKFANPILIYIEMSFLLALLVSLPYIAYEIYMFLAPGLYPNEKRFIKSFIFSFSFLFILGVLYGYYLIMPLTYKILIYFTKILGVQPFYDISDFFELTILGLALNGIFFTIPIFIVLAIKFGLVPPELLEKNKRYIYVGLLIITAIITPDPTPVSMILLSIPFIVFFEVSLYIGKRVAPRTE